MKNIRKDITQFRRKITWRSGVPSGTRPTRKSSNPRITQVGVIFLWNGLLRLVSGGNPAASKYEGIEATRFEVKSLRIPRNGVYKSKRLIR